MRFNGWKRTKEKLRVDKIVFTLMFTFIIILKYNLLFDVCIGVEQTEGDTIPKRNEIISFLTIIDATLNVFFFMHSGY